MGSLIQSKKRIMMMQESPVQDLLHFAARTKKHLSENGTKTNVQFETDGYYSIFSGQYYLDDAGDTYANLSNGILTIAGGLSPNFGPGFPVIVQPNTTYYISGMFENCGIYATYWDGNGDFIKTESYSSGKYQITTPANCAIACIVFRFETRYIDGTARNVIMTDTPIS